MISGGGILSIINYCFLSRGDPLTKPLAERGMEKIMTGDNDGEQFALNHWLEGGLQLRPPMHAEEAQYSVMML